MAQDSFSFSILNSHNIFNVVSTRSWKSINPFVGYETMQRIAMGLEIPQKEDQILSSIVFAEQVHSSKVHICNPGDEGSIRLAVDALISNVPHHLLGIYSSDCIPLLVYDPQNQVVGAAHAGYKGLAKGVIPNMIESFNKIFHSNLSNLIVGIGPFIHVCCYEIREDILGLIKSYNWLPHLVSDGEKLFLDLNAIVNQQLAELGILPNHIENIGICTSCRSDILFSSRKRSSEDERGSCFVSLISLSRKFN
jgi:polyphenol oxidase